MSNRNYVAYHVHTDYSLNDSATSYKAYIDKAVQLGQKAIAFSEHGNIKGWVKKKMYCDEVGIKYIHAVECYLTESHEDKKRDNFHTILIAKNMRGFRELNQIISISTTEETHSYYVGRISFDEFFNLSDDIIKISACLASPLNRLEPSHPLYERLVKTYDYLEIQPHKCEEQLFYNRHLACLADKYNKPLIAATDAHSLNEYKAQCRELLLWNKKMFYSDEQDMDLTYKSYDELVKAFAEQAALPERIYLKAIENTNVLADSIEDIELDTSLKYSILYGSPENDEIEFEKAINKKFKDKIDLGIIPVNQIERFEKAIKEEVRVFKKLEMCGFMLSMSELIIYCKENGIPIGPARGSVGGSRVAYVLDIIDLNPEQWHTVFSRFCNEDRKEVGDIDVDVVESDRPAIFKYIINRFTEEKTARVPTYTTAKDAAAIEIIGRAFRFKWEHDNPQTKDLKECKYTVSYIEKVKSEYNISPEMAKAKYPDIFYYFEGLLEVKTAQSIHPAGIVISPITLSDNYGVFRKDGEIVLQIDMEEIHEVSLVKYDLLVLKTIQVISDTCKMAGIDYPKSHEIDWNDKEVWNDMIKCPYGVFQMEGAYAFQLLRTFKPKNIFEMSLVTAALRPSGGSYRDKLMKKEIHKNPSPIIDELLRNNYGYLIYQEDTIKFLTEICGMSGSEADNVRRAIGRKDKERLDKALPEILDGYCLKSNQPRKIAEQEAKEFIKIIEDSANYQFGYNHSIAYCMVGYLCAYLRYYHPYEFCTAYLNCAKTDTQIHQGEELAEAYKISVIQPVYGASLSNYYFNKDTGIIAKGVSSIKYLSDSVATDLYKIAHKDQPTKFIDLLKIADHNYHVGLAKIEILIKLNFFRNFGNRNELLNILEVYQELTNRATAKSISKKKILSSKIEDEVFKDCPYCSDTSAKGVILTKYSVLDMDNLLYVLEDAVKSKGYKDWEYDEIIDAQEEYLGGIDLRTNKPEDRQKLLITDVKPLGVDKVWGYALFTMSIGTGKAARITAKARLFNRKPLKKKSIIKVEIPDLFKNNKGYWEIYEYQVIKE